MRIQISVLLVAGLLWMSTAQAGLGGATGSPLPVQLDVKQSVAEQLAQVEAAINSEDYSELAADDRAALRDALGRIRNNVPASGSVEQLSPDLRTAVFNDQELVNMIMTRAHADSRMVCERVRTTGSNRREQVCMTLGQRRQMREESRDVLRNWHNVNPKRPGEL